MGGRERRIRKRADFVRIQRDGAAVRTPHFILLVCARGAGGSSRLGLVASRKVGNAVVRNRIKRVCRECFRLTPTLVPDGIDLVVIPKPGAGELGLGGVRAEWQAAAHKLRAQCEKVLGGRA